MLFERLSIFWYTSFAVCVRFILCVSVQIQNEKMLEFIWESQRIVSVCGAQLIHQFYVRFWYVCAKVTRDIHKSRIHLCAVFLYVHIKIYTCILRCSMICDCFKRNETKWCKSTENQMKWKKIPQVERRIENKNGKRKKQMAKLLSLWRFCIVLASFLFFSSSSNHFILHSISITDANMNMYMNWT